MNMMIAVGIILINISVPLNIYPEIMEDPLFIFCTVSCTPPPSSSLRHLLFLPLLSLILLSCHLFLPLLPLLLPLTSLLSHSNWFSLSLSLSLQVRSLLLPVGWSLSLGTITVKMWRVFVVYRSTKKLRSLKKNRVCMDLYPLSTCVL